MTPRPAVRILSKADVSARRRALLTTAGCSLAELRSRARGYDLAIDQLEVLRELERLEFLAKG